MILETDCLIDAGRIPATQCHRLDRLFRSGVRVRCIGKLPFRQSTASTAAISGTPAIGFVRRHRPQWPTTCLSCLDCRPSLARPLQPVSHFKWQVGKATKCGRSLRRAVERQLLHVANACFLKAEVGGVRFAPPRTANCRRSMIPSSSHLKDCCIQKPAGTGMGDHDFPRTREQNHDPFLL
jgi:hypothetical protein